MLSNDIKLHTSFQTKFNPIENCTRSFFTLYRVIPKTIKIDICCFSGKHAALKRKSKDWSARDKDNVCELGDMSIRALLF